ncbi:hypothetical protein ACEPAI_4436 [Sanghuangporus weigelae]
MRIVTLAGTVLRLRLCASQVARTLHQNSAYREESAMCAGNGRPSKRELRLRRLVDAKNLFVLQYSTNSGWDRRQGIGIIALMRSTTSLSVHEPLADATPSTSEELDLVWQSRYKILEPQGYRPRQRYKPDWTPSWFKSERLAPSHEDYPAHWNSEVIDAYDFPECFSVEEAADFMTQAFEGIVMHRSHAAHSMFGPEEKERKVIGLEDQDKAILELSLNEHTSLSSTSIIIGIFFKKSLLDFEVSTLSHRGYEAAVPARAS